MEALSFTGVFEQGDGSEVVTQVTLVRTGDSIVGVDKSDYAEWDIRATISKESSGVSVIEGHYYKSGEYEALGQFILHEYPQGYSGEYSGKMNDGSNFRGYYKWLRSNVH